MLASLAPARRRFLIAVATLALLVAGALTVVAVRSLGEPGIEPVAQDHPGPVLLVPGYGGQRESLMELSQALRVRGRDATVVTLAGDGTGDLREQARVLDAAAQDALERTGADSVDVVGYSAGGVVARLWVRDFGGAELARRVLTLGSPHHGTQVAALAIGVLPGLCPTACQQLAPDSDLLRALNAGDETPNGPVWVTVWSTADEVVTPPTTAELDGALNVSVQGVCADSRVVHSDLPDDPLVTGLVEMALGQALPVSPTPGDCARLSS